MKHFGVSFLALALFVACSPKEEITPNVDVTIDKIVTSYEIIGSVKTVSNELIAKDATVEKIGGDFIWSEGPVWIKKGDYLLFTDVPGNTIYKFKEGKGITTWMHPSGHPDPKPSYTSSQGANGLYPFDKDHIIVPDHGHRTLYKLNLETKTKTVLAERFEGKRFNSPNDAVLSKTGVIYFTDPPYGLEKQDNSEAKELQHNGVYALYPDGAIALLDDKLTRPNGIILSPDQGTLYVANSDPEDAKWMAYSLDENGMPDDRREILNVTADVKAGEPGLPDGMAIDSQGNLYATGPGGVLILSPEGERLGLIRTGTAIANCAFGDDGHTLYMTSNSFLARVKTKTKGLGF